MWDEGLRIHASNLMLRTAEVLGLGIGRPGDVEFGGCRVKGLGDLGLIRFEGCRVCRVCRT